MVSAVLSGESQFRRTHQSAGEGELSGQPAAGRRLRDCGTTDIDLTTEPIGTDSSGKPVFLKEICPAKRRSPTQFPPACRPRCSPDITVSDQRPPRVASDFRSRRGAVHLGQKQHLRERAAVFRGHARAAGVDSSHYGRAGAGVARRFRDDRPHQPGGIDQERFPAGLYLQERGVKPFDFNSYGARRGDDR